jgi:hypothetical protein
MAMDYSKFLNLFSGMNGGTLEFRDSAVLRLNLLWRFNLGLYQLSSPIPGYTSALQRCPKDYDIELSSEYV